MNTKTFLLAIALITTCTAMSQAAYTAIVEGDCQISTTDVQPLYLTGGAASINGTAVTFLPIQSPITNTQVWTVTKGTGGNATDKYIIKSKIEAVPLNTQTTLKLTSAGGIPITDGKFHAHTIYRIGDGYAVKVAAGLVDATTTYSAKFWRISNDSLRLTASATNLPVTTDYIIKFIPYAGTGLNTIEVPKRFSSNTGTGIKIVNQQGQLSIYSSNGTLCKELNIVGDLAVNLRKGFYILRLQKGTNYQFEKVIVN